jgi:hypothetical protein
MSSWSASRSGRAVLLAVVVCAALVSGGCGNSRKTHGDPLATATPSASPSVDASTASAMAEVLQLFNSYAEVANKAYATSDYRLAMNQLSLYAADPLLSTVINTLYRQNVAGTAFEGKLIETPRVTEVSLARAPKTATIEDCVDTTGYHEVFKTNRSPVPSSVPGSRFVSIYTVTFLDGKGWRITDGRVAEGRSC